MTTLITLAGNLLDPTPVTGTVRAVRFEQANTCSSGVTPSSPTVDIPTANLAVAAVDYSMLTVSLAGTVGLTASVPSTTWSVCVDFTISGATTQFMQAGSITVFQGECFFVLTVRTSAGAQTPRYSAWLCLHCWLLAQQFTHGYSFECSLGCCLRC